jgi:hypothetical protein
VSFRPVFVVAVLDRRDDRRSGPEQTMTPCLSLVVPAVEILLFTHLNLISLCPSSLPRIVYDTANLTRRRCEGRGAPSSVSRAIFVESTASSLSAEPSQNM